MTTAKGRGVRVEFATAFGTAKTVTAVTKAKPGVATSAAHGLTAGTVGFMTATGGGMPQIDGQAVRVYSPDTNTFQLQSLNTSGYSDWNTGTFTPATTWVTLSEATGYNFGSGGGSKLDDTKLIDIVVQEVPGVGAAETITIDTKSQTVNAAAAQWLDDAAIDSTYVLGRITFDDGAVRVFRGIPSRASESLQQGQLATGQIAISVKGLVLKGAA